MSKEKDIFEYCQKHAKKQADLLHQLERDTHLKTTQPRMLSGMIQGRFLSFISHLVQPKYILEVGTFTGFSALCMAEGLPKEGKIITLEVNEELETLSQKYFDASPYKEQIDLRIGHALDILPTLDYTFDLVFIDAQKTDYSAYYDLIIDKVRKGGIIISDNVLWDGKVTDLAQNKDKKTKAIHAFNVKMLEDERIDNFILPLRDGLNIARKLV